jgi:hypothetical protein
LAGHYTRLACYRFPDREYAAVILRRELAKGAAALRRLSDGHQETVPLADVEAQLSG